MYKKIIEKAFDEENEKYIEYLESEEFKKSFEEYKGDSVIEYATDIASRAMSDSIKFSKNVLEKLTDSEDFKRELFKDMLKQAEEEKRRTGENPFDI